MKKKKMFSFLIICSQTLLNRKNWWPLDFLDMAQKNVPTPNKWLFVPTPNKWLFVPTPNKWLFVPTPKKWLFVPTPNKSRW